MRIGIITFHEIKLQNPFIYIKKNCKTTNMDNWWQRFVWLLKKIRIRSLRQEKVNQLNRSWYRQFMTTRNLHLRIDKITQIMYMRIGIITFHEY